MVGNSSSSNSPVSIHTYTKAGIYQATLTMTFTDGSVVESAEAVTEVTVVAPANDLEVTVRDPATDAPLSSATVSLTDPAGTAFSASTASTA